MRALLPGRRPTGFQPILRTFEAGPEWKKLEFPFQDFDGTDGHDVMGIFWGASGGKGPFRFQLDEAALQ
ncbi:MAG: hypothetical protein ACE5H3_08970 [Planctomycetota bacterium]